MASGLPRWLPSNDTQGAPRPAQPSGALQLTTTPPLGWTRPEGETGVPIFITRGVVGGVFPPAAVFNTAVHFMAAAGDRYFWAKIGLSETITLMATSLEIVSSDEEAGYVTGDFGEDGSVPPFFYVPLGTVSATGSGAGLAVAPPFNTGAGSIVVALHIAGITVSGGNQTYTRQLTYWRTADAA